MDPIPILSKQEKRCKLNILVQCIEVKKKSKEK